jgi:hypothetical protein
MKPEQIYCHLKDLSEKLGVMVSEENFKKAVVRTKSGYCVIKNEKRFIVDKHLKLNEKVALLASFLGDQSHENLYVVPAVREVLIQHASQNQGEEPTTDSES